MEAGAVITTFKGLMHAEPEVAEPFLHAAVYASAIRTGVSPRNIVEALYKAMPASDVWPSLRDALVTDLDREEEEAEREKGSP